MLCTFGPQHGKFLYDGAGKVWVDHYNTRCVPALESGATNLKLLRDFMNREFNKPSCRDSKITERKTY